MYIVVIGLGEVGRHLLRVLDREGHDVVAVDNNPDQVEHALEHFDVSGVVGYGASQDILQRAGVGDADLVVAVTDHDEVNLIAALAAKNAGARRVIARAQGNVWANWQGGVRYGLLGVDVVINPRILVSQELTMIARSHGANEIVHLARERITLEQITLTEEMRHADKPLAELKLPRGVLVAAVIRDGRLFIPHGSTALRPNDRVYLIGRPNAVREAEDFFMTRSEADSVCIIGGGVIGESMAHALSELGTQVLVIEQDLETAEKLAEKLDSATVVHGDGTDLTLLNEEEVGRYDFLAAATGEDEVNLMAALLAKQLNVTRTACVVNRGDYIEIYRKLGIDVVLSPRMVASDQILRYSRRARVQSLTVLEDGQAEVIELRARKGCKAVGAPLMDLDLPTGLLVAAIVRDEKVTIARGDTEIAPGDTVILLASTKTRGAVEELFSPGAA